MILFVDVDGTLIDYQGHLPKSAHVAVEQLRKNEHKIYLCTGCSICEIEEKKWSFAFDGMICGNGCYINCNNEVIYHKTLTKEQCIHFVDWCKKRELAFRLECNSGMYISDDYEEKSRGARWKYIEGKQITTKQSANVLLHSCMVKGGNLYRDDVNKTAFVLRSYQDYLDAKEIFCDVDVGTWGGKGQLALYGDVSPRGISKANAVQFLMKYHGIKKEETIAFGDANVDIPMFSCCDNSVAMGNASNEVKEAASYITSSVDQDGFYQACKYYKLL